MARIVLTVDTIDKNVHPCLSSLSVRSVILILYNGYNRALDQKNSWASIYFLVYVYILLEAKLMYQLLISANVKQLSPNVNSTHLTLTKINN